MNLTFFSKCFERIGITEFFSNHEPTFDPVCYVLSLVRLLCYEIRRKVAITPGGGKTFGG